MFELKLRPSDKSFIYIIRSKGPNIDAWDIPLRSQDLGSTEKH